MKNLVLFHTGRGGRFYNAGYKTCKGLIDSFNPEYYGINIFYDENEDNPDVKLDNGEVACTLDELNSQSGTFNIDNDYNSYDWCPISELDENELEIMIRDLSPYEYKDALIDSGVDSNVFQILEETGNLLKFVDTIYSQVSFEDFKNFDEVLEFDNDEDYDGNSNLVEIDGKFYTII